ncbi:MAG: cytochrome c biogenesis CcdA family protein [Beijerinckiaceae bacterium]
MPDITLTGVLLAGLLSFLSPCVLPLVPPYLAYMAGTSVSAMTGEGAKPSARVLIASVLFVLGFSTVFVLLGAGASSMGRVLRIYGDTLSIVAGIVIIIMGLHFLGVFRIGLLYREARLEVGKPAGLAGAYLMGLAFAFGWTPCIGPVLGAVMAVAGSQATVGQGMGLLAVYSLGLGIPFLLAALFMGPFTRLFARHKHHMGLIEKIMGGLLVLTGIAFLTGGVAMAAYWLLETFPALGKLG